MSAHASPPSASTAPPGPLARGLAFAERIGGIPGKYSLPVVVGIVALALGGIGESADIAYHVDVGRDESLFTVPHTLILIAVGGIVLSGLLALLLPGPRVLGTISLGRLQLPPGGLIILACGAVALAAFPLDSTWHALFGEDLTLWSPTHLLLVGGPTLSVIGMLVLLAQGASIARPTRIVRVTQVLLAGLLLGGLTSLQSEFAFGARSSGCSSTR